MEESSEAHMETDVTSTTEDVPEAQEVTGSNGNVEMVVIVEKVSEEETVTSEVGGKQLAVGEKGIAPSSNTTSPHPSPKKAPTQSPQKAPTLSPQPSPQKPASQSPQPSPQKPVAGPKPISPNKVTDIPNTITGIEHSYNKSPQEDATTTASPNTEETVDSSSKTEVLKEKNTSSPKKLSPIRVIDIQKSPKICHADTKSTQNQEQTQEENNSKPEKEIIPEKPALNGTVDNKNFNKNESANTTPVPIEISVEKEAPSEGPTELNTDLTEKEHNKSISRELKSLIKSAKESKIISECTQLTTKTRKSRAPLDVSNSNLNTSVEAEKIKDTRRGSDNSQKSNCSEKSEKVPVKRSMRSQNPEFVHKVKQFLNSVTSKVQKESDEGTDEDLDEANKEIKANKDIKDSKNELTPSLPKKSKVGECTPEVNSKLRSDSYCWRCHWEVTVTAKEKTHPPMACTVCPRAFHYRCLSGAERSKISADKNWVCPECMSVLNAESSETRSPAMKKVTLGMLCEMLNHALDRMIALNGVEPFLQAVDRNMFPTYEKFVVHPMDLSLMRSNINGGRYGSTEAFLADAQWILHNSIIFNTCEQGFVQSKLTGVARTLVRSCRAEMCEIEACPECYAAAHTRSTTWFTDVCSTPHVLLWAKLKGFPYWPAKGMSVNNSGLVDVRFFGAHDRAWVPAKDCYLYSEKDPNNFRTKRQDIQESMVEAEEHIRNISRKYGKFVYPPFKTQFDPSKLGEQLKMMIPTFEGEIRVPIKEKPNISPSMVKEKSRSNSKSSKSSLHDGDTSEGEEPSQVASRKMADGAHIARLEDDEKDKTMEVDVSQLKEENDKSEKPSRKRRRSEMEEASFLTIISSSAKEKKKKKELEIEENSLDLKAETMSQASTISSKEDQEKPIVEEKIEVESPVPSKDNEPSSSTIEKEKVKEPPKLTPIKLVISTKSNRIIGKSPICKSSTSTPKVLPIRIKQTKIDKTVTITKVSRDKEHKEEKKSHKRRNSKSNKSLNNSVTITLEKPDKVAEKKIEKNAETVASKDKKELVSVKAKEDANKSTVEKPNTTKPSAESPKPAKNRIQIDEDDTSLAVIAREVKGTVTHTNVTGLPTISSVRSLSTAQTNTTKSNAAKTIEVTIEPSTDSLLIPTSTVNVRKEAPKNKDVELNMVGRVGVRAFARMSSPEPQGSKDVEVEIKAEPIDYDDPDRQMEKLDMMKAFKLRPVNPPPNSLREVRINKVVMTPLHARKAATKPPEVRPRARKTFPQPRKPDDGRSELNSKNSMVYIPIQPAATPGPLRAARPPPPNATAAPCALTRPQAPPVTGTAGTAGTTVTVNNMVNTVTTPLVPSSISQLGGSAPPPGGPLPLVPTIGQLSSNVQTVPLITSVNGQWTFSMQPVMAVGGLDDAPSPPLLNGLPERTMAPPALVPVPVPAAALPGAAALPNHVVTSTGVAALTVTAATPTVVSVPTTTVMPAPAPPGSSPPTPLTQALAAPPLAPNRTPADTSANPGEPPRLQQRPVLMNPLDSHTPIGTVPTPSTAGPVTAKLNQSAVKLTDFFRTLLEDSLEKLDEPLCQVTSLKLQLEQTNWRHKQELEEMKHNHDLIIAEMRSSFEKDKVRLTNELRRAAQVELEAAVKAAKSKQWCANCSQEAQFYCCWNTSYCDYPCQRAHWNTHFAVCTQQRADAPDGAGPADCRLQPLADTVPKNTTAPSNTPTLTVGGKLAQARVANQDQAPKQQSSIIMSMVEDKSGNQTLRCLGTYKPPSMPATNQISPIIINKQIINNEDSTGKKVVTSGGYLIVGANSSTSSIVTPPRRTHSIQYFT